MDREDLHGRLKVDKESPFQKMFKSSVDSVRILGKITLGSHEDALKLDPFAATNLRNGEDGKPSLLLCITKELELNVEEETETVLLCI